jgi:hypothetical protein
MMSDRNVRSISMSVGSVTLNHLFYTSPATTRLRTNALGDAVSIFSEENAPNACTGFVHQRAPAELYEILA